MTARVVYEYKEKTESLYASLGTKIVLYPGRVKELQAKELIDACKKFYGDYALPNWKEDMAYSPAKTSTLAELYPKYYKPIPQDWDSIDVYGVHHLFQIQDPSGMIQHASKKLLLSGVRTGGKSQHDDIREARDTLNRWLALNHLSPEPLEINVIFTSDNE